MAQQKIFSQLRGDAVDTGAIALPPGHDSDGRRLAGARCGDGTRRRSGRRDGVLPFRTGWVVWPRSARLGWAAGVLLGVGPFIGYIASRTVGVPGDPADVGNWGDWVGTLSLIIEAGLIMLSIAMVTALPTDLSAGRSIDLELSARPRLHQCRHLPGVTPTPITR
jgi:hypothetical protein